MENFAIEFIQHNFNFAFIFEWVIKFFLEKEIEVVWVVWKENFVEEIFFYKHVKLFHKLKVLMNAYETMASIKWQVVSALGKTVFNSIYDLIYC